MAEIPGLDLPLLLTIGGIVLIIMEAMAPGAHLIVLGVALLAAGLVGLALGPTLGMLATPLALAGMVLLFGSLALVVYREFDFYGGKGIDQTSDSDSLSGQIGRVTERVTETNGEVKLEDGGFNPYFRARSVSGEIEEGTEVFVVDPGGGNVVTVDSLEQTNTDEIDRELERARERMESEDETDETSTATEENEAITDPQTDTESR
ncbi:MAG: hypothetical protein ACI9PP_001248 [Halobacteriales archaeon]|jgi:membrane protein implicated in regulation of membrane protease activity